MLCGPRPWIPRTGVVSGLLKAKRREFLHSKPLGFFWSAESREGRVYECSLLALDPVFVRRVAEGLELDSDRIELIEHRARIF
jgi:hypothetical protein